VAIPPFVWFVFILDFVLLVGAIIHGSLTTDALYHFREYRLITFLSSFQLIAVAVIAWFVYETESNRTDSPSSHSGAFIWVLVAVGFVFLAFDEVMKIHEAIDFTIHRVLKMQESAITDRIDDVIVLAYAIVGLVFVYRSRASLQPYLKAVKPILIYGVIVTLMMVAADITTNRRDIISDKTIFMALSVAEEVLKIAAEALFIFAAYACYRIARDTK